MGKDDDEDKKREEKLDKIELVILAFLFAIFTALIICLVGAAEAQ
jgi:hypothetical protein